jgi:hypothetical protein
LERGHDLSVFSDRNEERGRDGKRTKRLRILSVLESVELVHEVALDFGHFSEDVRDLEALELADDASHFLPKRAGLAVERGRDRQGGGEGEGRRAYVVAVEVDEPEGRVDGRRTLSAVALEDEDEVGEEELCVEGSVTTISIRYLSRSAAKKRGGVDAPRRKASKAAQPA